MSVMTDISPSAQRHSRTRVVGPDSIANMVWIDEAEALPSQHCNEDPINPTASVAGDRQRRAAELASTKGK
jgi:hypothetical protein